VTGPQLKAACKNLIIAIGGGNDNPDFLAALIIIANGPKEMNVELMARNSRIQNAMWYEIEQHLNNHYHIEDQERFTQAVAELEGGWA